MKRLFLFLIPLLLAAPALAQDSTIAVGVTAGPDAPADTSGSVLPDIAPREIEIRGQLEIAFPSLERQPLIGFNPPPRVRELPPDEGPYVEEYKQESADLPPSPLQRPEAPPITELTTGEPMGGVIEASGGRYYARLVRARIAVPATGRTAFHADLDYGGSDGYLVPDDDAVLDDADVRTPYDALEAALRVTTTQDGLRAGGALDGFANRYTLYGAVGGSGAAQPDRRGGGLGGTAWVEGESETFTDLALRVRYGAAGYETDVRDGDDADYRRFERRLDASTRVGVLAAGGELVADASFAGAGLDQDGLLGDAVQVFSGGAGYRFVARGRLNLQLGARFLAFNSNQPRSNNDIRGSVQNVSGSYVVPDVRLDLYPSSALRLYAESRPGADLAGLAGLYEENPYLVDEPLVFPSVRQFDAEGGAELFAGPLQLKLHAGYERYPSFLFFEHADGAFGLPYRRGLHTANYAEATVIHGGGDVSVALPAGFSALLGVSVREGSLGDGGGEIPYFAPLTGEAALSYAFAGRRGLLQLTGHYEGKRYVSRALDRRVGDYVDLDLSASYDLARNVGLVARLDNLAFDGLERWEGYPQPPLVMTAGLRVMW